ncbi:MAG: hypothetical protein ACYC55_05835 [Candidatus Geothermincolia bacterium]
MAKKKLTIEPTRKWMSFTGWTAAMIAAVVVAIGGMSMLGVAKNLDSKVAKSGAQILESNELNLETKESLKPSFTMNDQATEISGMIKDTLNTMVSMKDDLAAIADVTAANNGVLTELEVNTNNLTAAIGSLVGYIEALAGSIDQGNVATGASLDILKEINAMNAAIGVEMAEIDAKLSNSLSYKLLFTVVLPLMP